MKEKKLKVWFKDHEEEIIRAVIGVVCIGTALVVGYISGKSDERAAITAGIEHTLNDGHSQTISKENGGPTKDVD